MDEYMVDTSSTTIADLNQDGVADTYVDDLDGDGSADWIETDTDSNGYTDVGVLDSDGDGVGDLAFADTDGNQTADTAADLITGETVSLESTGGGDLYEVESTGDTGSSTDLYDVPSGTDAVMNAVNQSMSDASVLYNDAVDPGSESSADVAAATESASNAAQNAQSLEGYTHQQEVSNDIAQQEADMTAKEQAMNADTDAYIEQQRAESVLAEGEWVLSGGE